MTIDFKNTKMPIVGNVYEEEKKNVHLELKEKDMDPGGLILKMKKELLLRPTSDICDYHTDTFCIVPVSFKPEEKGFGKKSAYDKLINRLKHDPGKYPKQFIREDIYKTPTGDCIIIVFWAEVNKKLYTKKIEERIREAFVLHKVASETELNKKENKEPDTIQLVSEAIIDGNI